MTILIIKILIKLIHLQNLYTEKKQTCEQYMSSTKQKIYVKHKQNVVVKVSQGKNVIS